MPQKILFDTPIGALTVTETDGAITAIAFGAETDAAQNAETPLLRAAEAELRAYFAGTLREFSVPIRMVGSEFSMRVWAALREIPYGQTVSYGELAVRVGSPNAARAVGMANHRNPIPLIVPCHRVIGANGKPVGYAGGIGTKAILLNLERENSAL